MAVSPNSVFHWDDFQREVTDRRWVAHAACRGMDPAIFFPERGASSGEARKACLICTVRTDCLNYGKSERFGIWGGAGYKKRKAGK